MCIHSCIMAHHVGKGLRKVLTDHPLPPILYKVGVHGVEGLASVLHRGRGASPLSFRFVVMEGRIPTNAHIIQSRSIGVPAIQTDCFDVTRIIAWMENNRGIDCRMALSPITKRPYFIDERHISLLDDASAHSSMGIHAFTSIDGCICWVQALYNRNMKNTIDSSHGEPLYVDLPWFP